jgi:ankyrin repeat protein
MLDLGTTALMKAAENGHDLCANALLEAGSDPNKATNGGTPP